MDVKKILFKELPFLPDKNQVFYIENGFDDKVNNFIINNYSTLKDSFAIAGMDFYYMPYLLREQDIEAKVRYYAPYLSSKLLVHPVESNVLVQYISDDEERRNLQPSLVFGGKQEGTSNDVWFIQTPMSDVDFDGEDPVRSLLNLVHQAKRSLEPPRRNFGNIRLMKGQKRCDDSDLDFVLYDIHPSYTPPEELASIRRELDDFNEKQVEELCNRIKEEQEQERSIIETERVLRELSMVVQKLRLEGVSLMAIHEFIDKQEPLSKMVITPDYRIFLPDYNNMEIEMGALPKAVYFLFLRYPEGIIYKHMPDYFGELLNIYRQLRPNTDEARLNLTITKVVNPLGNALNENIARVRKAFVEKFDEHLANKYIITGERGLQYTIPLDRNLIVWEE